MRDEMVEAGDDDGEIWVTEIGWSSGTGENPLERGEQGQAERLAEAIDYFLSVRDDFNIQNVTWFAWRDLAGQADLRLVRRGRPVRGRGAEPEARLADASPATPAAS